jgi:ankyrin repeat protein
VAGWTPLLCACINGHAPVVKSLIAAGANIRAKDRAGRTAMDVASEGSHSEIADLLLEAATRPPPVESPPRRQPGRRRP